LNSHENARSKGATNISNEATLIDLDPLFHSAFGVKSSRERIDKGRLERAIWTDESGQLRQVMPHWNDDEIKTKRTPGCERARQIGVLFTSCLCTYLQYILV